MSRQRIQLRHLHAKHTSNQPPTHSSSWYRVKKRSTCYVCWEQKSTLSRQSPSRTLKITTIKLNAMQKRLLTVSGRINSIILRTGELTLRRQVRKYGNNYRERLMGLRVLQGPGER